MPISIDKLRQVRTVVTHDRCPDGIISGLVLMDALNGNGNVRLVFAQYNSPSIENLKAEPGILFCDFSPPADRAEEFLAAGAIVLDHHKTAEAVVRMFGEDGIYASVPGVSGAVLAYREVWKPLMDRGLSGSIMRPSFMEEITTIAGIRDTWVKDSWLWESACIQAAGVLFPPMDYYESLSPRDILLSEWPKIMWVGALQVEKVRFRAARAIRDGYKFTSQKGTKVVVFGNVKLASDAAEVPESAEFDLVVGFDYFCEGGTPKLILSTRSRHGFDCSAFCKANGGGGHPGAAGFNIVNPTLAPWLHVQDRLAAYESTL